MYPYLYTMPRRSFARALAALNSLLWPGGGGPLVDVPPVAPGSASSSSSSIVASLS